LYTLEKLGVDAELVECARSRLQELACKKAIGCICTNDPMTVYASEQNENLTWVHLDSLVKGGKSIVTTRTRAVNRTFDVLAWSRAVWGLLNVKPGDKTPEKENLAQQVQRCVKCMFSNNAFDTLNSVFTAFSEEGKIEDFRKLFEGSDDEHLSMTRVLNEKFCDEMARQLSKADGTAACNDKLHESVVFCLAPLDALMKKKREEHCLLEALPDASASICSTISSFLTPASDELTSLEQDLRQLSEPEFSKKYISNLKHSYPLVVLEADLYDEIMERVYSFYYSFRSEVIYGSSEIILRNVPADLSTRLKLIDTAETNRFVTEA